MFPNHNSTCNCPFLSTCYMDRPSHSSWSHHPITQYYSVKGADHKMSRYVCYLLHCLATPSPLGHNTFLNILFRTPSDERKTRFGKHIMLESSWNVMARDDAREGKWRGNWRMEWVDSTLHTAPENGVSIITTADAHTSAAGSRLNWRPCRFKWARPFRWKTKSGFCACAITFQKQST